uniref:Uncharacterized protein n=1 Tax=Leptobrachium leishanense TaxID=445787 RepID=A0A8C5W8D7_9ANUR
LWAEGGYMFSTPAMLKSKETGKICVSLQNIQQPINLNVVLEYAGTNITIITQDVPPPAFQQCNDVTVTVKERTPVFIMFSAVEGDTEILDRKTVVIEPMENMHFIQMDKPIYKAGNTVRFRVISMDSNLKPVQETVSPDPNRSRMVQWKDQVSDHGMLSFELKLIDDASSGYYYITAERSSGPPVSEAFQVEEYSNTSILPYSSNCIAVVYLSVYTYGKPASGTITARCCVQLNIYGMRRNCYKNLDENCRNITGKVGDGPGISGTYTGDECGFTDAAGKTHSLSFLPAGIQTRESSYTWMTSQLANIRFDYEVMKPYYKNGIPYNAVVRDSGVNVALSSWQVIELEINGEHIQELKTDEKGTVTYHIDTSSFVMENFTVRVSASYKNPDQCYYVEWYRFGGDRPEYPTAEYLVQRFYSPTSSFLQIQGRPEELSCQKSYSIDVAYKVTPAGIGQEPCQGRDEKSEVIFNYLVMGRARILQGGQKKVDISNSMNGTFSFDMPITPVFAPYSQLVVYSLMMDEIIVDTISINVNKCFQNQVSLKFSEEKVTPGSSVDLEVTAAPLSLCALRGVDAGLLVLYPHEQFSAERILYSLPYLSLYGYSVGEFNLEQPAPACLDPNTQIFYNGQYYRPTSSRSDGDTYSTLKVRAGKTTEMRVSARPHHTANATWPIAQSVRDRGSPSTQTKPLIPHLEGRASLSEILPDTITEWKGSAACMSEKEGFGMTQVYANVTTFQPFFVELTKPNSIIRGEKMVLLASVANFLGRCTKVTISPCFPLVLLPDPSLWHFLSVSHVVLCPSFAGDLSIVLSAVTSFIGETCDGPRDPSQPPRNDTVIQTVRVEAEGIRKEETSSHLVCVYCFFCPLSPSHRFSFGCRDLCLFLPGDIMGLPLHFLENMIQLPTGCGEQNIAVMDVMSPVLEYLNSTHRLSVDTLQKAKDYLSQGYYRQLRFRHISGCYMPFERSGGSFASSLVHCFRLTAKTFLVFENVKSFIYIDPSIQEQALIFLSGSQQLDTGCFPPKGYLFWSQGEEEDVYAYTAMLASALLQSHYSTGETLLNGAMSCLKAAYSSGAVKTLYNKALIGFVFALAGEEEGRARVLNELKSKAISEGGTTHWERKDMPKRETGGVFSSPSSSAEVGIASYVALIILKSPTITQNDKNYIVQIIRWLIRHQNSFGAFRSTQDTVVAMQAFGEFAKLINIPNSQNTVRISSANGEIAKIDVTEDNRLVLHRQPLPSVTGKYGIAVSGKGCCLIQSTVRYNVPVPKANSAFALTLASSSNCMNGVAFTMILNGTVRYNGLRNASNMAIIDIKLLSGYRTDYLLLNKVRSCRASHLILYRAIRSGCRSTAGVSPVQP